MLELFERKKISKPIRLIELFAGYGSQALALERLGFNFEHWRVVEFDKYAVTTYNALHGTNFYPRDINKVKSLDVWETDKYEYIMTYSFPCTDLSLAGKGEGMKKGTRSGLLWEVERLLSSSRELPQILVMENVPMIHSVKHKEDFDEWIQFLAKLGYNNHWKDLNAKDFGIPQNRVRTFMVSILGDYEYEFPKPFPLKKRLKDLLEDEVDENFYISDELLNFFIENTKKQKELGNGFRFEPSDGEGIAKAITTRRGNRMDDNFIIMPEATIKGYSEAYEGDGVYLNRPHQKRGVVQKDMIQTLTTSHNDFGVVTKDLRIRKLTVREVFRLMGLYDQDIDNFIHLNSNAQLYKQAGNSIVVNVLEHLFGQFFI